MLHQQKDRQSRCCEPCQPFTGIFLKHHWRSVLPPSVYHDHVVGCFIFPQGKGKAIIYSLLELHHQEDWLLRTESWWSPTGGECVVVDVTLGAQCTKIFAWISIFLFSEENEIFVHEKRLLTSYLGKKIKFLTCLADKKLNMVSRWFRFNPDCHESLTIIIPLYVMRVITTDPECFQIPDTKEGKVLSFYHAIIILIIIIWHNSITIFMTIHHYRGQYKKKKPGVINSYLVCFICISKYAQALHHYKNKVVVVVFQISLNTVWYNNLL